MRGQTATPRDGTPESKMRFGFRMMAAGGDLDINDYTPSHDKHFVHAGDEEPWRCEFVDQLNAQYRERGHA